MALEQNFQESLVQFESVGDLSIKKSIVVPTTASDTVNGCFDCNICLDSAHDPVVTLCGHLYCWPCIYKWLHARSSSPKSENQPKCPICKASISPSSLVPLYGRGTSPSESEAKRPQLDQIIPRRPPAVGVNTQPTSATRQLPPNPFQPQPQAFHHQQYLPRPIGNYSPLSSSNFRSTAMTSFFSLTIGMFGDMVLARMVGSPDTSLFTHPHPNSFSLSGSISPRMRRQEMQMDKSLNRVSIFLLCCFVLCLLLF